MMDANILGQPSLSCVNVCVLQSIYSIEVEIVERTNTVIKKEPTATVFPEQKAKVLTSCSKKNMHIE